MSYPGKDLFDEKSLGGIFLKSVLRLSHSLFNTVTTCAVLALLALHALYFDTKLLSLAATVRSMADVGLSFGSSILGFLIAGFTIFATLTKPSLFIMMYKNVHPKSGLNYLKHNFFAFIEVFVVYLVFLGGCLLIKIFGGPDGALLQFLKFVACRTDSELDTLKEIVIKGAYIVTGTFLYYSLVSLKSFVFNIYHIVITSIVWEMNPPENQ